MNLLDALHHFAKAVVNRNSQEDVDAAVVNLHSTLTGATTDDEPKTSEDSQESQPVEGSASP